MLEAALGIWQQSTGSGPAHGTYVNRDHFAGLLEMSFPFLVMYPFAAMRQQSPVRDESRLWPAVKACISLGLAALILVAIIDSMSRMGFVAALFSLFVIGSMVLGAGRARWRKWLIAGVVGSVVLGLFIFLPTDQLIERFAALASSDALTGDDRLAFWRDSLRLIAAYPIFGCGLGGYESALLKYKTSAPLLTVDYAHSDCLQLLAELGVVGFLILGVFIAAVLAKAVRSALDTDLDLRYRTLASAGAMAAILSHSLVDFNLYIPANALVLAWICGIAVAGRGGAQASAHARRVSGGLLP